MIFDVDGTLVDSNDAHAVAWAEALREFDIRRAPSQIRPLIGMGGDKLLPQIAGLSVDSDRGQQLTKRRAALFRERYLPHVHAFAGVRALFERLLDDGLQLAIASSGETEEVDAMLGIAGIADLELARASAEEVRSSKPDPDAIEVALARLRGRHGVRKQVLMVGDTPYDIEAARRAGLGAIAFRCGGRSDTELAAARLIVDGPAELLRRYTDPASTLPWDNSSPDT
ncbi:MAG TPA: HAD family hydrolase [Polyangia bacterium]|nr:HAD family hydrolase [Polyangia bacterium]